MTKRSQPAEGSGRPGRGAVRLQRANLRGGRTEHAGQRCVHGHRRSPGRHPRTDRHDRRWRFHNLSVSVAQLIRVDRGGFRRPCLSSASQRSSGGRSAGARRVMVLFTAARRRGSRSGGFAWAYGPNERILRQILAEMPIACLVCGVWQQPSTLSARANKEDDDGIHRDRHSR